jgi:hypothetical protein
MADFVLDKDRKIYCNLFLNPETMHNNISTWMTLRENSCFLDDAHSGITIIQECGKEYTGLMYILLHETTHIIDYVCSITPYISHAIREIFHKKNIHTEFTEKVWETYDTPVEKYDFKFRREIAFYNLGG